MEKWKQEVGDIDLGGGMVKGKELSLRRTEEAAAYS